MIKDDMLLFHMLHVDRREPELVFNPCVLLLPSFSLVYFSTSSSVHLISIFLGLDDTIPKI